MKYLARALYISLELSLIGKITNFKLVHIGSIPLASACYEIFKRKYQKQITKMQIFQEVMMLWPFSGKRVNWLTSWSTKQIKQDVVLNYQTVRLKALLSLLGIACNDIVTTCSNKSIKFNTKNSNLFTAVAKQSQAKREVLSNWQSSSLEDVSNSFSSLCTAVVLKTRRNDVNNSLKGKVDTSLFFYDAHLLSLYIAQQIELSDNFKSLLFKQDIVNGLAKISTKLLRQTVLSGIGSISGIKLELAGKWKQTASNRKQRVVLMFGSVNVQTVDSFTSTGCSIANTRFGSCCTKVTFCYKPK